MQFYPWIKKNNYYNFSKILVYSRGKFDLILNIKIIE